MFCGTERPIFSMHFIAKITSKVLACFPESKCSVRHKGAYLELCILFEHLCAVGSALGCGISWVKDFRPPQNCPTCLHLLILTGKTTGACRWCLGDPLSSDKNSRGLESRPRSSYPAQLLLSVPSKCPSWEE